RPLWLYSLALHAALPISVLFFPKQGQTCHAYCTYCFRWAQFVGEPDLKFASGEVDHLVRYLKDSPQVTSVLFTGGDPMIMGEGVDRKSTRLNSSHVKISY